MLYPGCFQCATDPINTTLTPFSWLLLREDRFNLKVESHDNDLLMHHHHENNDFMVTNTKVPSKKTYNSRYSLVVTDPTTNPPVTGLTRGERTGSRILQHLWSYVPVRSVKFILWLLCCLKMMKNNTEVIYLTVVSKIEHLIIQTTSRC